jgi:hypothetical protein
MLQENLDRLRDAIRALVAARDAYDDVDSEGLRTNLDWMIGDLRALLTSQWLMRQAMEEGTLLAYIERASQIEEIGAKLSAESTAAISGAIKVLQSLLGVEVGESTVAAVRNALLEVVPLETPPVDATPGPAISTTPAALAPEVAKSGESQNSDEDEAEAAKIAKKKRKRRAPVYEDGVFVAPEGTDLLYESRSQLLGEAADSDGNRFDMLVLRTGISGNRVRYLPEVMEASLPLLEGRAMYVDHAAVPGQPRSLRDKVGVWSNPRMMEIDGTPSIVATADLFESTAQPWFLGMVREAIEKGRPEMVGISIVAAGKTRLDRDEKGPFRDVEEILAYASADAVSEPGAGGRPLNLAASAGKDPDVDILEKATSFAEIVAAAPHLTIEQIKAARPDLFNEDGTPKDAPVVTPADGEGDADSTPKTEPTPVTEGAPVAKTIDPPPPTGPSQDEWTAMQEGYAALRLESSHTARERLLAETRLPSSVQDRIRAMTADKALSADELSEMINCFVDLAKDLAPQAAPAGSGLPSAGFTVPYGSAGRVGPDITERLQLAVDQWFGVELTEDEKSNVGQPIRSMREFYMAVTGDINFSGHYNPEYSIVSEALPTASKVVGGGTVTMSNLLGTSMNRRLVQQYRSQNKWWEPVVSKTRLENMKQQDRVRLHNFGSLTERTTDGAEYVELTWNETAETFTPTEYGNIVTVGRRAIINDDLEGIRRLPELLGSSSILTLNEYISNLFTQNSGTGPTLTDAVVVFHNASHQGNTNAVALNRANLLAGMKVIMKMQNDASKRIGLFARHLLVPPDLFDTGWELLVTPNVPDSANNARNVITDGEFGIRNLVVVPNWTDTNNWYIMADPAEITGIELGFLFGQEEPDMLSQQDPTSGLVWTNDVLSWKVRHDYGADWTDYRGAYAGLPS